MNSPVRFDNDNILLINYKTVDTDDHYFVFVATYYDAVENQTRYVSIDSGCYTISTVDPTLVTDCNLPATVTTLETNDLGNVTQRYVILIDYCLRKYLRDCSQLTKDYVCCEMSKLPRLLRRRLESQFTPEDIKMLIDHNSDIQTDGYRIDIVDTCDLLTILYERKLKEVTDNCEANISRLNVLAANERVY